MNEEEKDIIEFWKDKQAIDIELLMNDLPKFIELIENQKAEIEKKDKIIDLIAGELANYIDRQTGLDHCL